MRCVSYKLAAVVESEAQQVAALAQAVWNRDWRDHVRGGKTGHRIGQFTRSGNGTNHSALRVIFLNDERLRAKDCEELWSTDTERPNGLRKNFDVYRRFTARNNSNHIFRRAQNCDGICEQASQAAFVCCKHQFICSDFSDAKTWKGDAAVVWNRTQSTYWILAVTADRKQYAGF